MEGNQNLNLVQKLAKVRGMAEVVAKDKRGYNYSYADITQILAKITAGMKKYNISLIPSIVPGTVSVGQNVVVNTKFDKTGRAYENTQTEMLVFGEMLFTWVNDDNPEEKIEVPWFVTGSQSDPSQALGSGLTYCMRYFLSNYFQIAQADSDVDTYRTKQKEAAELEEKEIAADIIARVDKLVRELIAGNPDASAKVKTFMGKYVKGANYLNIKSPAIAAKLLADFKKEFGVGEEGE